MRSGAAIYDGSDLYYFNGQATQSLTDDRVRTEIEKSVFRGNLGLAEVFNNPRDSKLYLAIPTSSEEYNTKAYVLNYTDNTWGSYDTARLYGFGLAQVVDETLLLGYDDCAAVYYNVDGLTLTYSSGASRPTILASKQLVFQECGG